MEPYIIEPTDETPGVKFDPGQEVFEITGKSLPEDVSKFYDPLLEWLDGLESFGGTINFDMKLMYFNTASSKKLLDLFYKLEEVFDAGVKVTVRWHFLNEDEDMEDAGYEYSDLVEIPFELIGFDDD